MSPLRMPQVYVPVGALAVLIVLPHLLPNVFYIHILIMMFLFAALGGAWNLLGGYGGQLSLGNAAFFGVGAYASTLLVNFYNLSPWIGMLLGAILAMLLSVLVGALCFRLRGAYFAIATIGLAEVLRLAAHHFRDLTYGAQGITVPFKGNAPLYFQFASKIPYYYIALLFMLAVILLTRQIERSRLGNYLVAIGQNQEAAEALGINSAWTKQQANLLMSLITAFGGTFYAQYIYFIDPPSAFGLGLSIQIALVAIVGGVGTVMGAVLGAVIMESLIQFTQIAFAGTSYGLELIVYGSLLVVMILLRPTGLIGWVSQGYGAMLRKLPGGGLVEGVER